MFVFDNSEDLDIATYEYRLYTFDQVDPDPNHSGYFILNGNVSINSGTITPYRQGFNLANVFTVAVENSSTTSTTSTTSAVSYYGAIRGIDTSGNAGPWTLITETDTDTPLIDEEFIGSLTAAKITTGTIGAAEITLNGANSIIKSSGYNPGLAGWKITGDGNAEFNQLTVRTALDIGGSDASSFHVDVDGNLWLGASTYGSAPFRISNTGNVDVGGDDASSFHIDVDGNIWSGASIANKATAPFRVSNTGQLTASSVTITNPVVTTPAITGGSITGTSLDVGTGTSSFHVDATGRIWSGNAVFASGPFSVTATGALTATGATITGAINATSGTINNTLIVGTSGSKINIAGTGTSSSTAIYSGTSSYGSGGFWLDASGRFSLGDKLYFDGTNLTVGGTINATGGTMTGYLRANNVYIGRNVYGAAEHNGIGIDGTWNNAWVKRDNGSDNVYFRVGTSTRYIQVDTGGTTTIQFPNFTVSNEGVITATGGSIAGWNFTSTQFSSGGTVLNSNGTITIGVNSDSALRLNSGSDISMYAVSGGNSTIFFYRDGYSGTDWDSKIEQSAAGNFIVYGNDFNGNYYATLLVRSYAYSGIESRSVDRGVNDDTLAVTRVFTSTAGFNTDIATSTQMVQFFKKNKTLTSVGVGYIRATGASTVPSFVAGSDERLKDDIEIYGTPLIEDIKNINVYDWYDKDDVLRKNKVIGFLAKEFYPKYTTVITGKPDEVDKNGDPVYMQMAREDLIPHMFGVIKHLVNKVDELERKIENV